MINNRISIILFFLLYLAFLIVIYVYELRVLVYTQNDDMRND